MKKIYILFLVIFSFQIYSQNSHHIFSVNTGIGIDNNQQTMFPIDLGYKYKFSKYFGIGANLDYWFQKSSPSIPEYDEQHRLIGYTQSKNRFLTNIDILPFAYYKNLNFSVGYSFYYNKDYYSGATTVGNEIGTGDGNFFYHGITLQAQYLLNTSSKFGFDFLVESRFLIAGSGGFTDAVSQTYNLKPMYSLKVGVFFN